MSRVVLVFVACFCALLFVNVHGESDIVSILSPDGTYNPRKLLKNKVFFIHVSQFSMHLPFYFSSGTLKIWTRILVKLKDFTLPAGDEMLDKWVASLHQYNKELKEGNMSALTGLFQESKSVVRALLPHIPDPIVRSAVASMPDRYERELEKVMASGGGKLEALDRFFKTNSRVLISAMKKTKPTAETLN